MAQEQQERHPLGEALLAGLGLVLVDSLASGIWRTPWRILALQLGLGLAIGLGAGLLALLVQRRGLGFGLVLACGAGLNSLSMVSKELTPDWHLSIGGAAGVLALLAGAAGMDRARSLVNRFVVLACVPLGSLLVSLAGASPVMLLAAAGLPFLAAGLTRSHKRQSGSVPSALISSVGIALLLLLPVGIKDQAQRRDDLSPSTATAPADAPDLLLVIIDTMRADALGSSGTLAELGKAGMRFEECISSAPWTLPSVSSILTGLLPSQHGATSAARVLPGDVETLAESLRAAGYQTAAFTGGAFVGPSFQLDQGFEHFDSSSEFGFRPFRIHVPLAWRLAKNRFLPLRPAIDWVGEYPAFGGVCQSAERWLAQRDPSRPYFVLLHTYEIHDYYLNHGPTDAGISAEDFGLSKRFRGRLSVHPEELVSAPQSDLDYFESIYTNRLLHVEQKLGRFLDQLESSRKRVTAVVSDHGEGFDAKRTRVHHGGRLHEDQVRVPLILHAPGLLPAGVVRQDAVSTLDLAPTFLELAGLPQGIGLTGKSLLKALDKSRPIWSEERSNGRSLVSMRAEGWKLLRERGEDNYFELSQDPTEELALPEAPQTLKSYLDSFSTLYPPHAGESAAIDEETAAHLRSLGYLDGDDED